MSGDERKVINTTRPDVPIVIRETTREYEEAAIQLARPSDTLLEIGCASGATLKLLSMHVKDCVGVNSSLSEVKAACERYPNLEILHLDGTDVRALSHERPRFDIVLVNISERALLRDICPLLESISHVIIPRVIVAKSNRLWDFAHQLSLGATALPFSSPQQQLQHEHADHHASSSGHDRPRKVTAKTVAVRKAELVGEEGVEAVEAAIASFPHDMQILRAKVTFETVPHNPDDRFTQLVARDQTFSNLTDTPIECVFFSVTRPVQPTPLHGPSPPSPSPGPPITLVAAILPAHARVDTTALSYEVSLHTCTAPESLSLTPAGRSALRCALTPNRLDALLRYGLCPFVFLGKLTNTLTIVSHTLTGASLRFEVAFGVYCRIQAERMCAQLGGSVVGRIEASD